MATTWVTRWQAVIAKTSFPGVYRLQSGGHMVRARATDPTNGRKVEIKKRLPLADAPTASAWLEHERQRVRSGNALERQPTKPRFSEFAATLFEEKIALREIRSAGGRDRWRFTLEHLILGTAATRKPPRTDPSWKAVVAGFGAMFIDKIQPSHVEAWRVGIGRLISAGAYSPVTANGWLSILKRIMRKARKRYQLGLDPVEDTKDFDTSEHPTYTEEEPNSLTSSEAQRFLRCMRAEYPQHYAMVCLGTVTGLRPSSLRPLRRKGKTPDVLWEQGAILVRRSHNLDIVMERTKTKLRQKINVPPALLAVLKWHVQTQLETQDQIDSDLLFPREDGEIRSESSLKKAFASVTKMIGLQKKVTPRAMRRTFMDLTRGAKVEGMVTKSISGHLTEQMREHYSTVSPQEQRAAVGGVLRLVAGSPPPRARRAG